MPNMDNRSGMITPGRAISVGAGLVDEDLSLQRSGIGGLSADGALDRASLIAA
jgi:hypothetical protein